MPTFFSRHRGPLKLAGVAALLFLTGGPAVIAENDDSSVSRFWLLERQRAQTKIVQQHPLARASTRLVHRPTIRHDYASPAESPRPAESASPAVVTQGVTRAESSFLIAVIGDSLAQMLAQGIQESFGDRPEVAVLRKARESSGLVRDDFYDWPKAVRELINGTEHLSFAVMMIGSNDRQPLKDADGTYDPLSPKWREIYVKRVEDIAQQFRDKHIPLVWVGLPVMRNERLSSDIVSFNEIYRTAAEKMGETYVDTWEAFADDRGQYDAYGPDISGQIVKLRAGDGVHFTKAGALKLAHFAEHDIRRAVDEAHPAGSDTPAVDAAAVEPGQSATGDIDINAQIRRQILGDSRDLQAGLPIPAPPAEIYFPIKPAAGPVLPLTAVIVSPGGLLATRQTRQTANATDVQAMLERIFVQGRPPEAKPGRADDFAWPRR